ncbi:EF-hand domain-containing protein [Horticoccus sp. 23ND18S-11]|uniref:EF-hand domain-containing protein n=1 Tax=Horticoccus sp. 23ND18S-11 TaxID=3391832 RepID=UPI0039C93DD3
MTSRLRLFLATLTLGATCVAQAEISPARSVSHRHPGPIVAVLDTDRDGTLSATEIAAAPVILAALDANADGLLSPDELRITSARGRTFRVSGGTASLNVVLALDANFDGEIQPMELSNAVSSLKRLDLNGDGELTPDELQPVVVVTTRA